MAHRADFAGQDHFAALLQGRRVAIGEVHHTDLARFFHRRRHFQCERRVGGERLLAEDVLARAIASMVVGWWIPSGVGESVELALGQRFLDA